MKVKAGRNWAWRDFWKADREASCVPQNRDTEHEIYAHWRAIFAGMPDNSRILDIATGNGILLRQAAEAAGEKRFDLTGIDLADINPHHHVSGLQQRTQDIRFIGGVNAERLPFEAQSFDVVVSQYGLEYASLDAALDEVERVLRPKGYFCWLAHTKNSEVVMQNRDHHVQVNFLLAPGGPIAAMDKLISQIRRKKDLRWSMAKLDRTMRSAEQFCRDNPPAGIVTETCNILADVANRWHAYYPADLVKMIENSKRELVAHRQRIKDLQSAVVSDEREQQLRDRLSAPDWEDVLLSTLRVGSAAGPIGLLISARRSDLGRP